VHGAPGADLIRDACNRAVPERIVGVLVEHEVAFAFIGGLAAVAHGSPLAAWDVGITAA